MRSSRTRWLLPLLLCSWWPGLQGCAPALHEDVSGEPCAIPGGVADPATNTIYVQGEDGDIEAIDLKTGQVRWSTRAASIPLAVHDKKLIAQAAVEGERNQIKIVVLDPRHKGTVVSTSDAVTFPEWVCVELGHGRSFSSRGRVEDGNLLLFWEARAWYALGAQPSPMEEEEARKFSSGVAKVDLTNGRVEMLTEDKAPPEFGHRLPKELQNLNEIPKLQGSPYVWSWHEQPLIVGEKAAVLAERIDGMRTKLVLMRWDLKSGKELEEIELLPNVRHASRVVVRPNGLHVFMVHQETEVKWLKGTGKGGPTATEVPTGAPPSWWILSLETGKVVGKVPMQDNVFDIELVGERVFFGIKDSESIRKPNFEEQPRQLCVIDLKSGKKLWERAILPDRHLHPLK